MTHLLPIARSIAAAALLAAPGATAFAAGPGVGGVPTTPGGEDSGDPAVGAHRAIVDTQKKSRTAIDALDRIYEQSNTRACAAADALHKCQRIEGASCRVEERDLETARIEGDEAKQLAAMEAYEKLGGLKGELRDQLATNVVMDPWSFMRIQHRSFVEDQDRLGDYVKALDSLDQMRMMLDELVRNITAGEIDRQHQQLHKLKAQQEALDAYIHGSHDGISGDDNRNEI